MAAPTNKAEDYFNKQFDAKVKQPFVRVAAIYPENHWTAGKTTDQHEDNGHVHRSNQVDWPINGPTCDPVGVLLSL